MFAKEFLFDDALNKSKAYSSRPQILPIFILIAWKRLQHFAIKEDLMFQSNTNFEISSFTMLTVEQFYVLFYYLKNKPKKIHSNLSKSQKIKIKLKQTRKE